MDVTETGGYKNITASTAVRTGRGRLLGIFVASASATPTIKVYDGTDNTGAVITGVFTPIGGTFYPIPAKFGTGCYVEISGTVNCTTFVEAD